MNKEIKLNLGCGKNKLDDWTNVDKYGEPDLQCDLEVFPWPWEDSSVSEITLNHVLEHLGQMSDVYLGIIKELYRICKNGAVVHIASPHPRHDDFISDPTHVRIVTPESFSLFSKKNNHRWIKDKFSNSPLGIYLDVDFEIVKLTQTLDPVWYEKYRKKEISGPELELAAKKYNNVIKEFRMDIKTIK
jgi:predicted SAM-dependent methyltransferase